LVVGLAVGCSGNSSSSANKVGTPSNGPPKAGESKGNVGKGGIENPPPP
jgi:hypothetical protein